MIVLFIILKNTSRSREVANSAEIIKDQKDLKNINGTDNTTLAFKASALCLYVQNLPEAVIPAYRKKREYISSLLARHEIDSKYASNKQLFIRLSLGVYSLNKDMMLKIQDNWYNPI